MKILFICKHNRFRSKVAEAIFNKLNKNKENTAESAGLILDEQRPYVEPVVIKIMKENGYYVMGKPRRVTKDMINNFDLIIIVADNVNKEFFKKDFNGKIIQWKIKDCDVNDVSGIRERINEIEEKIKNFIIEN